MQDTDVCIIGAGLSGLALGRALHRAGRRVIVLDQRDRPGGRVLSQSGYDLGPAWIWPHNRRMLDLLAELGLRCFPQYSQGRLVFEDASGAIRRDLTFATMGGALRVDGGLACVTDRLATGLGNRLQLGCRAQTLIATQDDVTITTGHGIIRAAQVVLAMPPRLIAALGVAMPDVPTWMAGQAKLVVTYATPFWRDDGLNGDAISHRGPLVEIHDASAIGEGTGALFGFVQSGAARQAGFQASAVAQLARVFGPQAGQPVDIILKDWGIDPATATLADQVPVTHHPSYRSRPAQGRIIFAGSELAPEDGGFLEGALTAAEAAFAQMTRIA